MPELSKKKYDDDDDYKSIRMSDRVGFVAMGFILAAALMSIAGAINHNADIGAKTFLGCGVVISMFCGFLAFKKKRWTIISFILSVVYFVVVCVK